MAVSERANIPELEGASGEDNRDRLAAAFDEVVLCSDQLSRSTRPLYSRCEMGVAGRRKRRVPGV